MFAQQEDNLLRREYQVAMEEHVQNMIAALSMYSSDIYYENENVLRTRRVKLIRVFFRSEQAKMYDFLKIGVETQDNYLDVMEFLRTIPVVLPRVTFNMSVEEISPYVRLASGEFKLPVKVAITFVDLNTNQERTMPSRVYNVYYWQSENGNFAVSSMDLLREQQQTVVRNEGNASEWIAQEINITMPRITPRLCPIINRPRRPGMLGRRRWSGGYTKRTWGDGECGRGGEMVSNGSKWW